MYMPHSPWMGLARVHPEPPRVGHIQPIYNLEHSIHALFRGDRCVISTHIGLEEKVVVGNTLSIVEIKINAPGPNQGAKGQQLSSKPPVHTQVYVPSCLSQPAQ